MKLSHLSTFAVAALIGISSLGAPAHAISLEASSRILQQRQAENRGVSLDAASRILERRQAENRDLERRRAEAAARYAQYQKCYDYATYTARTERGGVTMAEARRANAYCGY